METPKIADFGSLITPGREYRIKVTPTINNSTRSLRYVKEADRQCAYSVDRYLRFYRTYTRHHCSLECEANFTLNVCRCVPLYLPSTCDQILHSFLFSSFHFSSSSFFRFYFSPPFLFPPFSVLLLPFLKLPIRCSLKKKLKFQVHTRYEKHNFHCDSKRRLIIPMCTFCTILENTTISAPVL